MSLDQTSEWKYEISSPGTLLALACPSTVSEISIFEEKVLSYRKHNMQVPETSPLADTLAQVLTMVDTVDG